MYGHMLNFDAPITFEVRPGDTIRVKERWFCRRRCFRHGTRSRMHLIEAIATALCAGESAAAC
jgi:hypothetical protein